MSLSSFTQAGRHTGNISQFIVTWTGPLQGMKKPSLLYIPSVWYLLKLIHISQVFSSLCMHKNNAALKFDIIFWETWSIPNSCRLQWKRCRIGVHWSMIHSLHIKEGLGLYLKFLQILVLHKCARILEAEH